MMHTGVGRDHLCQPQGPIPAQRCSCLLSPVRTALSIHLKVKFHSCHKHINLPSRCTAASCTGTHSEGRVTGKLEQVRAGTQTPNTPLERYGPVTAAC